MILLGLGFCLTGQLAAQNNPSKAKSAPSDAAAGYTYDFNLVKQLLIDYQIKPNDNNKDVKILVKENGFPKLSSGKSADAAYHDNLTQWMEKNPSLIIQALKNRKDIVRKF